MWRGAWTGRSSPSCPRACRRSRIGPPRALRVRAVQKGVHVPGAYLLEARVVGKLQVDGGDADLPARAGREVGAVLLVVAGRVVVDVVPDPAVIALDLDALVFVHPARER